MTKPYLPLEGITVLDLSKVIAGPLCTQYLGELGADVIKVESAGSGDDTRAWPPQVKGQSATFLSMNHNKRSLAVDLKSDRGREIVHRLAARSDIAVQGFATGTAERLKVDYASLKAIRPDIIYCEISGYGRDGPMGHKPGYDVMAQAFSGMMSTMGESTGGLVRVSFSPIDQGTGMHAFGGVLAALLQRNRTGEGTHLRISLLETAMGYMNYMLQASWARGTLPRRMGSAHESIAPYQAFEAKDGYLMLGAGNDAQWGRLCHLLGMPQRVEDPEFSTSSARVRNFDATVALVQERVKHGTVADWIEKLEKAGLPCSPVMSITDAVEHPQMQCLGQVVQSDHPAIGRIRHLAHPVSYDGLERSVRRPPPLLGQHSREILTELGLSSGQIDDLISQGAVESA